MPNQVGYVDNSSGLAHHAMLAAIKSMCEGAGWTTLRYDTASAIREWIAEAPGYTGPDGQVKAYVGMRAYHSVASDYYNLSVAAFTGYVSGNSFTTQPGYAESGIPAHNNRIDYWMTVNNRRLAFALKVGTPVYESGYAGFFLPYATPRQYPYPMVCGGMLTGIAATRFSDTSHFMPYKGGSAGFLTRFVDGTYKQLDVYPWSNTYLGTGTYGARPANTYYPVVRAVSHGSANVYGELDGIAQITGYDNAVENTLTIDGKTYVVIQDVYRTGFDDYYAMTLDP